LIQVNGSRSEGRSAFQRVLTYTLSILVN